MFRIKSLSCEGSSSVCSMLNKRKNQELDVYVDIYIYKEMTRSQGTLGSCLEDVEELGCFFFSFLLCCLFWGGFS